MRRNPIGRKALSFLLSFAMIQSVFGVDTAGAFAAVNDSGVKNSGFSAMRNAAPVTLYLDSGDIVITETGYSVNNGTEVLCTGGYEITQSGSGDVSHRITVRSGNQDITLQGAHAKPADGAAFEIENGAEADITLAGSNSLDSSVSSDFCAGLSVNEGSTVRISGTGSLTATGQPLYGAGIGGNNGQSCGTVEISGGTVTATGGDGGAGIGGGFSGSGGSITISGGTVKATGGDDGAGIGGGYRGSGGSITISGGSVKATGGDDGAGIGGGKGGDGGTITISGGTVTANGGPGGAGIGGGTNGSGGSITVRGGTVTAAGGVYGSGIGGGYLGNGGAVTISGADTHVTAKGQDDGEDIGSGYRSNDGGSLKVSDGATAAMLNSSPSLNTNASTAYTDCQIITGSTETKYDKDGNVSSTRPVLYLDSGDIVIMETGYSVDGGDEVLYTGGYVITQRGSDNVKHSITVQGGKQNITLQDVRAQPDSSFAAFEAEVGAEADITLAGSNSLDSSGSNFCAGLAVNAGSTVRISGTGSLTATGGSGGAGVGGNYGQSCGTIEISGGTVTANGNSAGGAGIGGGAGGGGGDITITGGNVNATGSAGGAGIGGGIGGSGGSIVIGSGTVTATGSNSENFGSGAGIGGGAGGDSGGTITVSGGTVTANGGPGGAGVGGGTRGSGGTVTVSGGTVTASGGSGGAGIGGGENFSNGGAGGTVTISGRDTQVTAKGQNGGEDIGSGKNNDSGGSLTVGGGSTVDGPAVELLSAGTNTANPDGSRPQFMNCVIHGAGAKDASGNDLSGCYDANGKIRLSISMHTPASAKIGEPVTLNASVTKYNPDVQKYQFNPVSLPGTVQFTGNGTPLGSPAGVTNGASQISWTPENGNKVSLKAAYAPAADDRYASAESAAIDYTPGKITPVIGTAPTASPINAGEKLSLSKLTGGAAAANGTKIPGTFAWAHPDMTVTASGSYEAIFTPTDTATYNTVGGILVELTVAAAPSSGSHSSSTSVPTLPSSLTDVLTNMTVDLSGARFPSWVTGVSLSASPFTQGGSSGASDALGGAVYRLVISQTGLNLIGAPFVYNIQLLDQSGSPVTYFTGTVTVRIPLPAGLRGTPRVFRYEESAGTFTDMNATVENGFLVFQTTHFSDYVVAGTGDSITLDTKSYQMPINGHYQIGVKLTGGKAAAVKVHSTNDKTAAVTKLKNGNYEVSGKGVGTAYIMFDVYDNKNHLLTHASVRVDVKTGIRPRGDSTRQIGVF
ncbi:beta strand repeat-containing protein [Caproicibacter sp.]|uniref:beta strand repeat-containing protein n=1 Tax=Caproicibacter sp. TaxID=2814884 RepID=UPI00398905D7